MKRLPGEGCRVYRLQTDDGERVIGRLASPAWVAESAAGDAPALSPTDAWSALQDGRTVIQLDGGSRTRSVGVNPAATPATKPSVIGVENC